MMPSNIVKYIFILAMLSLILFCGQKKPPENEFEASESTEEIELGKKHGQFIQWYDKGNKKSEMNYHYGKKHGKFETFWENGNLRYSVKYVMGLRDGIELECYLDGTKKSLIEYRQDVLDGKWIEWDKKGNITKSEIFKNGKLAKKIK
jgi:antitoxin component YwqK of YwqJK toxin-antitoxin module